MNEPRGIDVSSWQGYDLTSALVGCQFAIARVSVGTGYDRLYPAHLAKFQSTAGIIGTIGYHFLAPGDGKAQADLFLRHAGTVDVLCLDVEGPALADPTAQRTFMARVRQDGRKVLLYSSEGTWPGYLGQDANWVANYSRRPRTPFTFWQYSDKPLDMDLFHGTTETLAAFFNKPHTPTPTLGGDPLTNLFPKTQLAYGLDLPSGTVLTRTPDGAPYTTLSGAATLGLLGATGTHFHVADGDYGVYVPRANLAPRPLNPPLNVGA